MYMAITLVCVQSIWFCFISFFSRFLQIMFSAMFFPNFLLHLRTKHRPFSLNIVCLMFIQKHDELSHISHWRHSCLKSWKVKIFSWAVIRIANVNCDYICKFNASSLSNSKNVSVSSCGRGVFAFWTISKSALTQWMLLICRFLLTKNAIQKTSFRPWGKSVTNDLFGLCALSSYRKISSEFNLIASSTWAIALRASLAFSWALWNF